MQPPAARRALTPPLTLNDPFGSEIAGGVLYLADSDGNTSPDDRRVAVIRKFDLRTGAPAGEVRVERATWLNDLAVARDGTIYATQTGGLAPDTDPALWQVLKIAPDGTVTAATSSFTPDVLVDATALRATTTLADRLRAVPEWTLLAAGLAGVGSALLAARRRRGRTGRVEPGHAGGDDDG